MKKNLILILAGVLLGSTVVFAASKIFSDVPKDSWYTFSVNLLAEKGIISGYSDGTFRPDQNVNRAELAVMLDRVIEYVETGQTSASRFGDTTFDNCGPLSKYKDYNWFESLNEKYAQGDYANETVGSGGDACLSRDKTLLVFIPEDFAQNHGCGKIFRLDIAAGDYDPNNMELVEATGPGYCAQEFGKRVGDYIEYTSERSTESRCIREEGKYYFKRNAVIMPSYSEC